MKAVLILYPLAAMVLLSFIVAAVMLRARVKEMRRRRIHPQKLATRAQAGGLLSETRAADNYANQFEMPVLFHVLCLALFATQTLTLPMLVAAWLYVALRYLHSLIHISYNQVWHRFQVFTASAILLAFMWLAFTLQLLWKA